MRKNLGARMTTRLLWAIWLTSFAMCAWFLVNGISTLSLAKVTLVGLDLAIAFRIDGLSTLMFLLVSFLAATVGQFSLRYLDGEHRQWYFYRHLLGTVLAVLTLILSSNLIMFFVAWWGISWGLHKLLLYHEDRSSAVLAARKKILVSRFGDLAMIAGIIVIYRLYGSFDFQEIFALAQHSDRLLSPDQRSALGLAGGLFAFGSMTKSAQVPFHFWLPETMETPTPVSALMHAGIINAGGFLLIRLSAIMTHASFASLMLAIVGASTAVYGALVMITQNDIKKKLAYSTVSQMGMMIFACGIGAYTLALFHIVAHSLYKAHAFLTAPTLTEENKGLQLEVQAIGRKTRIVLIAAGACLLTAGAFWRAGIYLPSFAYGAVLMLGFTQGMTVLCRLDNVGLRARMSIAAELLFAITAFVALETGLQRLTINELASAPHLTFDSATLPALCTLCFGLFSLGFWLSNELIASRSRSMKKLYMSLWNDCYLRTHSNRILARIWPV